MSSNPARPLSLTLAASVVALIGCGAANQTTVPAVAVPGSFGISGTLKGGQQPVSGASIMLYAASKTGYAGASTPLLTAPVKSDAGGSFSITGDYTCQPTDLLYITSTGGNPGVSGNQNNSALAMLVGLGRCDSLTPSTFIQINELTTVASVWALSPFLADLTHLGTSATNVTGLANAFAAINQVVSIPTGTVAGPTLPTGATLPIAEINSLADILAACINTVDTGTSQSATCTSLFSGAKSAASNPTDTVQAAINLAQNPTLGLSLLSLTASTPPFQPTLTAAPTSWTIAINYPATLSGPTAIAADSAGNLYIPNATANTVTRLSTAGVPVTFATGLGGPSAVALDANDNVFIANRTASTITGYAPTGTSLFSFTGAGLNSPRSLAFDAAGNLWIANAGSNTISEFSSTGASVNSTGYPTSNQPIGLAINPR